ncbi:MAG: hypothetical protein WD018_05360 [Nitrosopumilaceae archaeon]
MINSIFGTKRGVSEIISTMMLLVVTVAGAVIFANFVQDGFFQINQNPSSESRIDSIQLTGYDTRDSSELIDIVSLNNDFNQMLCTKGDSVQCSVTALTADNIPSASGTEFIVLKIRNMNVNSIFLHNILINNIEHTWDETTKNNDFDGSVTGIPGITYPKAGKFSIIPTAEKPNPVKQKETNEILGDEEVRVIIKLSNNISQDIEMWDSVRILVNFGGPNPAEFIVSSGDAKW